MSHIMQHQVHLFPLMRRLPKLFEDNLSYLLHTGPSIGLYETHLRAWPRSFFLLFSSTILADFYCFERVKQHTMIFKKFNSKRDLAMWHLSCDRFTNLGWFLLLRESWITYFDSLCKWRIKLISLFLTAALPTNLHIKLSAIICIFGKVLSYLNEQTSQFQCTVESSKAGGFLNLVVVKVNQE